MVVKIISVSSYVCMSVIIIQDSGLADIVGEAKDQNWQEHS